MVFFFFPRLCHIVNHGRDLSENGFLGAKGGCFFPTTYYRIPTLIRTETKWHRSSLFYVIYLFQVFLFSSLLFLFPRGLFYFHSGTREKKCDERGLFFFWRMRASGVGWLILSISFHRVLLYRLRVGTYACMFPASFTSVRGRK